MENYLKIERDVKLQIRKLEQQDKDTGEFLSEVIIAEIIPNDKTKLPISVNKYFNNFHYRLFATMVGISVAIASRKNTGINLPLILDDIFYASDFENRTTIESFIGKLFAIFKEYSPEIPLQLIIFTHDQLIFESCLKAYNQEKHEKIYFAKLFPYYDTIDEGDFKSLVYKFPMYIPEKLVANTFTRS